MNFPAGRDRRINLLQVTMAIALVCRAGEQESGARGWSWALAKAGSTGERGLVEGGAVSEMEVMTPLSCCSTTLSSRPRSGPENRLCAATFIVMPRFLVIGCDKREAFAQGSEATKQSIFPRG